jgi:osmoprotectant transport system permease protein
MTAIWDYYRTNQSDVWHWTWTTVWLAAIPLAIGLVVALPVGWLASKFRFTYLPVITVAGALYTIPSLALLIALPGILGTQILDPVNVAVALTIYTIALLVRVVADGLSSVSPDTLSAASAMGYTARQRLFAVQLPMAVPVIGAGLRVAAVSNVSLVSVASLIGVPQLGSLFVAGNLTNSATPILLGLIFVVVLALLFDLIVIGLIRTLAPWQRASAATS